MVPFGIELGASSHPASGPAAERPYVRRREMSSARAIVASLLLTFLVSCMTEQYALLPRTEEANTTVGHCLASLGFRDSSQSLPYQGFIESDAALVAVWASAGPQSRSSITPGTTIWIRTRAEQLSLRFIPGTDTSDDSGTEALAHSFAACVPFHLDGTEVQITTRRSPDLR
jgi:hypothetical protein